MKSKDYKLPLLGILVTICLYVLSASGVFKPAYEAFFGIGQQLQQPVSGLASGLNSGLTLIANLQQIQSENIMLKQQLAQQVLQTSQLQEVQSQNQYLLGQLNIGVALPQSSILSRVLRFEHSPSPGYLYLECSDAQTAVGDLVVYYNYIVGEVIAVSPTYAKVRLVVSSESTLPVKVGVAEHLAVLKGQGGVGVGLVDISSEAKIKPGDQIKLLDAGSAQAQSLLLGTVAEVVGNEADARVTATVSIPVDWNSLSYLIVVKR